MSGRNCDMCADSLADYLPGAKRCDTCADNYGLEFDSSPRDFEPLETDSLADCLLDIGAGFDRGAWS